MKDVKRLAALVLVLILLFSACSLSDDGESSYTNTDNSSTSSEIVASTSSSPDFDADTYYIGNINTKKFHFPSCSYLPDEENQIILDTREEAIEQGYSPCGHCNP
jgi:competence protein ComEC